MQTFSSQSVEKDLLQLLAVSQFWVTRDAPHAKTAGFPTIPGEHHIVSAEGAGGVEAVEPESSTDCVVTGAAASHCCQRS